MAVSNGEYAIEFAYDAKKYKDFGSNGKPKDVKQRLKGTVGKKIQTLLNLKLI
jgi:hypothetical protein